MGRFVSFSVVKWVAIKKIIVQDKGYLFDEFLSEVNENGIRSINEMKRVFSMILSFNWNHIRIGFLFKREVNETKGIV